MNLLCQLNRVIYGRRKSILSISSKMQLFAFEERLPLFL